MNSKGIRQIHIFFLSSVYSKGLKGHTLLHVATLKEVTEKDLRSNFTCFAENSVGNTTAMIQLKRKQRGKAINWWLFAPEDIFWFTLRLLINSPLTLAFSQLQKFLEPGWEKFSLSDILKASVFWGLLRRTGLSGDLLRAGEPSGRWRVTGRKKRRVASLNINRQSTKLKQRGCWKQQYSLIFIWHFCVFSQSLACMRLRSYHNWYECGCLSSLLRSKPESMWKLKCWTIVQSADSSLEWHRKLPAGHCVQLCLFWCSFSISGNYYFQHCWVYQRLFSLCLLSQIRFSYYQRDAMQKRSLMVGWNSMLSFVATWNLDFLKFCQWDKKKDC